MRRLILTFIPIEERPAHDCVIYRPDKLGQNCSLQQFGNIFLPAIVDVTVVSNFHDNAIVIGDIDFMVPVKEGLIEGESVRDGCSLDQLGDEEGHLVTGVFVFDEFEVESIQHALILGGLLGDVRFHLDDLIIEKGESFIERLL